MDSSSRQSASSSTFNKRRFSTSVQEPDGFRFYSVAILRTWSGLIFIFICSLRINASAGLGREAGHWSMPTCAICLSKKKTFNMVTAGWALGHFCSWFPDNWRQEIDNALAAMSSVLKRDGAIVILETLTTGSLTPAPPTKTLGLYYDHLENEHGFIRTEIRTDYLFSSVDEAVELMEFFFGADLSLAIRKNGWVRVPEWTGVWGKKHRDFAGRQ